MALTTIQSSILRLLAENRRQNPGSYVAGGLAMNYVLGMPRLSRDIDFFHDSIDSLWTSWKADRAVLELNGYVVRVLREMRSFIEASVEKDGTTTEIQWGTDSAYRYFPLVSDEVAGFILHPLDLATNKLSALVGRNEPRDWIDVITASKEVQPLAFLASAACGKDPGFSPASMIEFIARRRYNQAEIDLKILPRGVYDAASLCRYWHDAIDEARETVRLIPAEDMGKAVMTLDGGLFKGSGEKFKSELAANRIVFHTGNIGGAWPSID